MLRLYPARYRQEFGPEIVDTITQGASEACSQGPAAYAAFCVDEWAGLLLGAVREWTTKWTARDVYQIPVCGKEEETEATVLRRRIQQLIRSMEFAIANHDFPRARSYSNQERITSAQLQRLLSDSREG
jgi:hypothetical protein